MAASSPRRIGADIWLGAYGAVGAVLIVSAALTAPRIVTIVAIWSLAPLLAVWVWRSRGPWLLVAALLCCWAGDVLGNPAALGLGRAGLYAGVAAFAAADVLLLIAFLRSRRVAEPTSSAGVWRRRLTVALPYLVASGAVLAATWSALGAALGPVALVYLLLIATMATFAGEVDLRAGVGAGLIFTSHLLFVLEVGGIIPGTATAYRVASLTLYVVGILLVALGLVRRSRR